MTREEAINYIKSSGVKIRMTRTEAINYLKSSGMSDKQIETVINALTCDDCISRQAVLDELEKPMNWTDSEAELQEQRDYYGFIDLVQSMPSVTPKFTDTEIQKMQELEQAQLDKAYELGKAEMQPCEDCISRTEAINEMSNALKRVFVEHRDIAEKAMNKLPSVIPKTNEDYISKATLLAKIDEERKHLLDLKMDGAEHILVHHARRIIEDMPSVTPNWDKKIKNAESTDWVRKGLSDEEVEEIILNAQKNARERIEADKK